LIRAGLASVTLENVKAGGRMIEVVRLAATDAGRRALAH
jgi:hypothetical protein